MKIKPFLLERWFAKYEFVVKHNLCASCASATTTADLLTMAGQAKAEEYLNLNLDYTPNPGHPQLREEIGKLYQNIGAQNIQVTTGASEAIFLLMNILLEPGDNVVVVDPIYQSLFEIALSIGVEVRRWPLSDEEFATDLKSLTPLMDEHTKMVVVNYPHSPTGAMITKAEQQQLIKIIEQHGCYLVSDEVYAGIVYHQEDILPRAADLSPLAISIGDFAKPWGMGGLRIGWLACQQLDLLTECAAMRDYTTMCNAAPAEFLATIALQHSDEILPLKISEARKNLTTWEQFCQQHPGVFTWIPPRGGFSAFPKVELRVNIDDFCRRLVEEYSVLLMPGSVFGYDNHIRIGFGQREQEFKAGLELLGKFIKSL
ncbi:aminotransferase class I/II-fold pyridoxal phosphate-dependent enzyme [Peptococcaceae bacterium 1198_IL3148]